MSSSSDNEFSDDDGVMRYSDDENGGEDSKKRGIRLPPPMASARKKSRSMDDGALEEHTGLSPRLHRMDIIPQHAKGRTPSADMGGVFFLEDDGVETFSADGKDPRLAAVREIFSELDQRVEMAAVNAGMDLADSKVTSIKNQVALRAAELENQLFENFTSPGHRTYRDAVWRLVSWIHSASESELREVIEGRWGSLQYLENRPNASEPQSLATSPRTQAQYPSHFQSQQMSQALIVFTQPPVPFSSV